MVYRRRPFSMGASASLCGTTTCEHRPSGQGWGRWPFWVRRMGVMQDLASGLCRISLLRTRVNNPLSDAPSEAPNPFLFFPRPLPYGGPQTLDPYIRGDIA